MNLVYFQEKAELENVVAVHVAHILTYQQVRDPESGQFFYKMDPDVESIVCYPGTKCLINLTYNTRSGSAPRSPAACCRRRSSGRRWTELRGDPSRTQTICRRQQNQLPVECKTRAPMDFFRRALK